MICESCGGHVESGEQFCRNCGAAIEEKKEVKETVVQEPVANTETAYTMEQPTSQIVEQGKTVQQAQNGNEDKTGFAIAGLVLGIIGLIAWLFPLFGYPVTIVGIVMSVKGMKTSAKGVAVAGLVLSILALVLTLGNSALGVCINCMLAGAL